MAFAKCIPLGFLVLSYLSSCSARWVYIDSANVEKPYHARPSSTPKGGGTGGGGSGGGDVDGNGGWYPSDPPCSGGGSGSFYPPEPPRNGGGSGWYPSGPPCSGGGNGGAYVGIYPPGGGCPTTPFQPIACPIGCEPASGHLDMAMQQWAYRRPIHTMGHVDHEGEFYRPKYDKYDGQAASNMDDQEDQSFESSWPRPNELRPNKKQKQNGATIDSEPRPKELWSNEKEKQNSVPIASEPIQNRIEKEP